MTDEQILRRMMGGETLADEPRVGVILAAEVRRVEGERDIWKGAYAALWDHLNRSGLARQIPEGWSRQAEPRCPDCGARWGGA